MKTYRGYRDLDGKVHVSVQIDQAKRLRLAWRRDLANHSPTGFEWGYGGSGPAQLALAILADALADGTRALRLHQDFKFGVIAALPREKWQMTDADVIAFANAAEGRAA